MDKQRIAQYTALVEGIVNILKPLNGVVSLYTMKHYALTHASEVYDRLVASKVPNAVPHGNEIPREVAIPLAFSVAWEKFLKEHGLSD